jgi:hypothetical protein
MSQVAADAASAASNSTTAPKAAAIHAAERIDMAFFSSITRDLHRRRKSKDSSEPQLPS